MKSFLPVTIVIAALGMLLSGLGPVVATKKNADPPPPEEPCVAPSDWFPVTPKPLYEKPDPDSDCDFYMLAWQTLLYITQPEKSDGTGTRFLSFLTKDDLLPGEPVSRFPKRGKRTLRLAPRLRKQKQPLSASTILQAQSQGILVDKNGRALYYAIHLNDVFADLVKKNGYADFVKLKYAPADQEFPRGSLEIKTSWRVVPADEPAAVTEKYFCTQATIALLVNKDDGSIDIDPNKVKEDVKVALLGIHVVFVADGHPEFVWATFEHVDNAPDGATDKKNKAIQDPTKPVPDNRDYFLYKKDTLASQCNTWVSNQLTLNEQTQVLSPVSRVFRLFPFGQDDAPSTITSLNDSVHGQIKAQAGKVPPDQFKRLQVWTNYDLKGATWLNNTAYFREGISFVDRDAQDPTKKILGGDTLLSNTTMETFTQGGGAGGSCFDNMGHIVSGDSCFSCHNTDALGPDTNRSQSRILFPGKRIGVSHILTGGYFLAHEAFNLGVEAFEDDWAKALVTNQSKSITNFLSDEFIITWPGVAVGDKAAYLRDVDAGRIKITSFVPTKSTMPGQFPWVITAFDSTVIVNFKAEIKGTHNASDISGTYVLTDTLIRRGSQFKGVSRQISPMK